MATFRVMCYPLDSSRGNSGELSLELCAQVIRSQNPDLVFVQHLGASRGKASLTHLAGLVGMKPFGSASGVGCAYLSRTGLHNLQTLPLGHDHHCIRADFDSMQERIHLLNLSLSWNPKHRLAQVRHLFGDQIINNPAFPCATIIGGDFGLPLWGCGQVALHPQIARAGQPLWRVNYPACFPIWGRSRFYFQGPVRALGGAVVRTKDAKRASNQLPLILDVETFDTRKTLKIKDRSLMNHKHPNPVCG
jgi:hypothetical protein